MNNDFNTKHGFVFREWVKARQGDYFELIDQSTHDELVIKINPKNIKACPMVIASRNGSTQIHLGERIWFDEFDALHSDDGMVLNSQLSERNLIDLLDAVWRGRVVEHISYKKGLPVISKGSVEVGGKEYRIKIQSLVGIITKPDKEDEIAYESYQKLKRE